MRISCIKLQINQGYTTMHGQPIFKIQISDLLATRPVGVGLFDGEGNTDGQTDRLTDTHTRDESTGRFRNFANAPKKQSMAAM
jgi:hypothetical protein